MKEKTLSNWLNILIIIGIILCSSFYIFLITIFPPTEPKYYTFANRIYVGYSSNIAIDPLDEPWNNPSRIAQHQVVEGLVDYNYSDHPNYDLIPKLAIKWHYHSSSEISFKLRENVWFHDGEKWNADVAIWNFERLMYFGNFTGELGFEDKSYSLEVLQTDFSFSNGTPLFSHFTKNSEYNFTIHLNGPFSPILDLLTSSAIYMLSPRSTPRYELLGLTDSLVGTGPFTFVRFEPDVDVRFEINPHYWGNAPWADELIFRIFEVTIERMNAGLVGQFDYIDQVLKSYIPTYKSEPGFTVEEVGDDLLYYYLEFYSGPPYNSSSGELEPAIKGGKINQKLNSTWRKALSLAINYTNIWENITISQGYPGCPAVSRSTSSFNSSLDGKMAHDFPFDGTFEGNIKKARELMQSMRYGIGWDTNFPGTNETEWMNALFRELEANQHYGSSINDKLNKLLEANWNLIGVNISIITRTWEEYLNTGENIPWEMDVAYFAWYPTYLDAFNILDSLLNNVSIQDWIQNNDPMLQDALENAAETTNTVARQNIYKWIQSYIFDITRPENPSSYCQVPLWVYTIQQVHKTSLKGIGYNVLEMLDCWNWYRI